MPSGLLAPTWHRRLFAAGLLAASTTALALDVGYLRLEREAGKPLRAEIPLSDRSPITAGELRARVAARETFEVAGLRYHPALARVQITARQLAQGKAALVIDGLPNDVPTLDLLLTVSDRSMLTIAEFRIDLRSMSNEFAPARAGSSLAAQQRQQASAADRRAAEPAPAATTAPTQARPQVTAATPATPAAAPAVVPAPAAGKPAAAASAAGAAEIKAQLTGVVQAWAQAWSRRDVKAYLDAYAPNFVSADRSLSTQEWAAQRRARIESRKQIEVRVEGLEFDPKGAEWVASFTQHYRSDSFREATRKQLLLRQIDGRWLIVAEREDR